MINAKLAILEELDRLSPITRPMRENDLILSNVKELFGCGSGTARLWLTEQIEAGRLIECEAIGPSQGRIIKVYRVPEGAQ